MTHIQPIISVSVKLFYHNKIIKKEFELSKDEINDMSWANGNTGDPYFDDLKNNDDRLMYRVNDLLHHKINADSDLDDWDKWEIQYWGDYDLDDFING